MTAAATAPSDGTEERGRAVTDSAITAVKKEDTTSWFDGVSHCALHSDDVGGHGDDGSSGDLGIGSERIVSVRHDQGHGSQKTDAVDIARGGNVETGDEGTRGREPELGVTTTKSTNNIVQADDNSEYGFDNIGPATHHSTGSSPSRAFFPRDSAWYITDLYSAKDSRKSAATLTVDVANRSILSDHNTGSNDVGINTSRKISGGAGVGLASAQHNEYQDSERRYSDPPRPTPPLTPLTPAPLPTTTGCKIPPSFSAADDDEEVGIFTWGGRDIMATIYFVSSQFPFPVLSSILLSLSAHSRKSMLPKISPGLIPILYVIKKHVPGMLKCHFRRSGLRELLT